MGSFLGWCFLPLDVRSVVTSCGDDVPAVVALVVESCSRDVLRVTSQSSALMRVLEHREVVNGDRSKVVTANDQLPVFSGVHSVDVCTICAWWEDSHDLPTQLTGGCLPEGWVYKFRRVLHLLHGVNVIEDLSVGLIDGSDELGVSRPIQSSDCRGVHERDRPVERVFSFI